MKRLLTVLSIAALAASPASLAAACSYHSAHDASAQPQQTTASIEASETEAMSTFDPVAIKSAGEAEQAE